MNIIFFYRCRGEGKFTCSISEYLGYLRLKIRLKSPLQVGWLLTCPFRTQKHLYSITQDDALLCTGLK